MDIRCPACEQPITVDQTDGETLALGGSKGSVVCPSCGFIHVPGNPRDFTTETFDYGEIEQAQLAHFTLLRTLGQGSFGTVWLAEDTLLRRRVALKIPVSKGDDLKNLMHEARAAATLAHPNIVSIFEVGIEKNCIYIASEFIDGVTLQDYLSAGSPPIARTIELMVAIAGALHHAHEKGIVHRDVKPGNILINKAGQPFVTDFGLAKRISADETISSEGRVMGTARYMAPEQASGRRREIDHRSDVYSLGVMLFEMLTGHTPYRGNVRAILHQKVTEDAPAPRKLSPSLPKDLETICLKCLERDPVKRYQSAAELAEELNRFRKHEPIKARPISSFERTWRWCRRRPAIAGLLTGLFLSLSCGLIGVSFFYAQASRNADLTRRALYRSQLNLIAEYLAKGDVGAVRYTLDRIANDRAMAALRGFEWHYFDALQAPFVRVANQGAVASDVAVTADGNLFAAVGSDRHVRVWDATTGELLRTLTLERGRFLSIVFSPTSGQLATGSSDGVVRFWNPQKEGTWLQQMKHGPAVIHVRFSSDGKRLLSTGASGAVRVWNVADQSLVSEIPTGKSGAVDARFARAGDMVVIAAAEGLVRVWNVESPPTMIQKLEGPAIITALAVSEDGSKVVTGTAAGMIRFWSVEDGTLASVYDSDWRIGGLEILKGTDILASISSSGRLLIHDTINEAEIGWLKTHSLTSGVLSQSVNGKYLVVGSGDGTVKQLRVDKLTQPSVLWHGAELRKLAFLPDGNSFIALDGDGGLRRWNLGSRSWSSFGEEANSPPVGAFDVHPIGKFMVVARTDSAVALHEQATGQIVGKINTAYPDISIVRYSPDGRQVALISREGSISIYHENDWNAPQFEISQPELRASSLAFSPDQRDLVVSYEDGNVHFYDATDGRARQRSTQVDSIPRALAYCESGRVLAIATETGGIYLYDISSEGMRTIIKGHGGRINALAVLPNGTTLVSGGRDQDLKLWDTPTGEQLTTLSGHRRMVFSIAASQDGKSIVSGGLEGDIRIWTTQAGGK